MTRIDRDGAAIAAQVGTACRPHCSRSEANPKQTPRQRPRALPNDVRLQGVFPKSSNAGGPQVDDGCVAASVSLRRIIRAVHWLSG